MSLKHYILSFIALFASYFGIAQDSLQTADTLIIDEINVVKSYDPKLKEAFKITANPVLVDTVPKAKKMEYKTITKNLDNQITIDTIKPAKIRGGEPLSKLQRGYAKIGIGTNTTPLADVHYNSLRNKNHSLGVFYKHLSSAGKIDNYPTANYSTNSVGFIGKQFFNTTTLSSNITFDRNLSYYYGVNQPEYQNFIATVGSVGSPYQDEKQIYSKIRASVNLTKAKPKKDKLFYDLGLDFYNFSDNYSATENKLSLNTQFIQPLGSEKLHINFNTDYYNSAIPGFIYDNTIFTLAPAIISKKENFNFKIGAIANASIDNASVFKIAPDAELNYYFLDKIYKITIGVNGGLEKNSFESITNFNEVILLNSTHLANSHTIYNAYLNLNGSLSKNTNFNLGASNKLVQGMPLFINTGLFDNKMSIVYDDVNQTTFSGELTYKKSEKLKLSLKGNAYLYKTDSIGEAWHKPTFDITGSAHYHYKNLIFKSDIIVFGERIAFDKNTIVVNPTTTPTVSQTKVLNSIIDINLGVEYRYTNKLSAFLDFYNLANQQQFYWNNRASQGLNILGGVTFSF